MEMGLEEARRQATECRELKKKYGGEDKILGPGWCALSILDDRITELEAEKGIIIKDRKRLVMDLIEKTKANSDMILKMIKLEGQRDELIAVCRAAVTFPMEYRKQRILFHAIINKEDKP